MDFVIWSSNISLYANAYSGFPLVFLILFLQLVTIIPSTSYNDFVLLFLKYEDKFSYVNSFDLISLFTTKFKFKFSIILNWYLILSNGSTTS